MPSRSQESAEFERMEKELSSAVISDALDSAGVRNHTLNYLIRPLRQDMVVAGRAMPAIVSEIYEVPAEPYAKTIEALDSLKPNQVLVLAARNCKSTALWGELLSTASAARGARGVIVDGMCRDTKKILEMDYPVFSVGTMPTDSKGRAEYVQYNCAVRSGDSVVDPGDIVFADLDGTVVIPRAVERRVLKESYGIVSKENVVRRDLLKGKLLREAWEKHGIL